MATLKPFTLLEQTYFKTRGSGSRGGNENKNNHAGREPPVKIAAHRSRGANPTAVCRASYVIHRLFF